MDLANAGLGQYWCVTMKDRIGFIDDLINQVEM